MRKQIREQTVSYVIAAFGLVAGLAWNEAIKSLIEELFPLGHDSLLPKFVYAIVITLIVTVVSYSLLGPQREKK